MDRLDKLVFRVAIGFVLAGLLLSVVLTKRSSAGSDDPADQKSAKASASSLNSDDQQFIRKAAQGNLAEMELGKLAVQKSLSNDVKRFGQQMIDDHGKAMDHLKQLAAKKSLHLPSGPDASESATAKRLSKLSGDQFDNAYMAQMLKDHKVDVDDFRKESKTTQDRDIRGFVTETLPILEDHLKKAETIAPDLKAQRTAMQKPSAGKIKTR
jgi:putative membrane protein